MGPGNVRHVEERTFGIGFVEVYRGGHRLPLDGPEARKRLERGRSTHQVAGHALGRTHGDVVGGDAAGQADGSRLGDISHRGPGSMGVEIVHFSRRDTRVGQRRGDGPGGLRRVAARRHHVDPVARHADAGELAPQPRPAGRRLGPPLEHKEPAPFPHHKAVAGPVEGPRRLGRVIGPAGEGPEVIEGGDRGGAEDVAAAGDADIDPAGVDPAPRQGQGIAARGAGCRNGQGGAGDPGSGRQPVDERGGALGLEDGPATGKEVELPGLELLGTQAEHEADPRPAQTLVDAGVGKGPDEGCQAHLFEPVEGCEFSRRDTGRRCYHGHRRGERGRGLDPLVDIDLPHAGDAGEEAVEDPIRVAAER